MVHLFSVWTLKHWLTSQGKYTNPTRGILDFCKQQFVGPSYAAKGQEDHETYTNLNDDTMTVVTDNKAMEPAQIWNCLKSAFWILNKSDKTMKPAKAWVQHCYTNTLCNN